MSPEQTGIRFSNDLQYDAKFNIYTYRNFYNGGGVAMGDVNGDSLPDLFFTANMLPNKLYLNRGNFQFEDVTEKAGIQKKGKWSTGVSMADVNGDGWLDIYVCNSGDIKGDNRQNELYINRGNGTFEEKAAEYGLDERGLSTHAAFFDYDGDNDLDLFLLNNSFKAIGSFNLKENERHIRDSLGGHKFFRNDGNHFTDVSEQAGIYGSVIGFGLGVTVGDVNKDGWQDIYVSNDFFERDYLYINQQNGTFSEELEQQMISISNASMGADMADINNDGYPEIFVTEMLPEADSSIKTKTTFESWDKYRLNLQHDYYHQFTRNMLQLNNGPVPVNALEKQQASKGGSAAKQNAVTFTDIGRFSGVHATDWSWGALISDWDLDGQKDIFVANGIYQDLTNEDYIQYISNEQFFQQVSSGSADFKKLIDLIPSNAVSNYMFVNGGGLRFENKAAEWGLGEPSFSNGSAYGDLDGDGDLDLVVNNVNAPAFLYRNNVRELQPQNAFLSLSLEGSGANTHALGAQLTAYFHLPDGSPRKVYLEQMPMRGFQSTVDHRLILGVGKARVLDSLVVRWPGRAGATTTLYQVALNQHLHLRQSEATQSTAALPSGAASFNPLFTPAHIPGLSFQHSENPFVDFDRDKLLFHMLSTQGPRLSVGDVNGDGLQDVFVCGARGQSSRLLVQQSNGSFASSGEALFALDAGSEDVDALFFDCDGDGDEDLYVCSGGSELSPSAPELFDRLYINEDGRGTYFKSPQVLPSFSPRSTSCVRAVDWDRDGDKDLFVGVRLQVGGYGLPAGGYLLQNNGRGLFQDVTQRYAPQLQQGGMITDAAWWDYDRDGWQDLVVVGEWMPITVLHNERGKALQPVAAAAAGLGHTSGWWNALVVGDVNGDGYEDLVVGGHGENSRFRASEDKPVELWVSDFDGNGMVEQVLTAYNGEKSYPVHLRHDLVGVLPYLKKKYLRYSDYKEQGIRDIFTAEQLKGAHHLRAEELRSVVVINERGRGFSVQPLPVEAQLSVVYGLWLGDVDGDKRVDVVLGGNLMEAKPEVGIYDGSRGVVLRGDGKGNFTALSPQQSGLLLTGAIRNIKEVKTKNRQLLLFARNNEALEVREFKKMPSAKEPVKKVAP